MIATTAVSANDFATTTVEKRARTSLPILSQSEAKCFRSCQRKHYIAYRLLVRPLKTANALAFGTLMHRALEAWWLAARDGTDRLEAAMAALAEATADPLERAKAEELMIGYHARWSEEILEVLAVEAEFETPIVNPATGAESRTYALGGKIDAIVRHADGRIYIMEHKCLAGDTRIFDHSRGRFYTLRELCEENYAPLVTGLAEDGTLRVVRAKVPVRQPDQPTIHVHSATGRRLVASTNHPFWTTRGWIPAGELTLDDWVAVPRHTAGKAPGSAGSDEAIRLVGYMIGDGCLSGMSFCKTDENVLADVVRCGRAFGETPRRIEGSDTRAVALEFRKCGPVAKWLDRIGLVGGSAEKRVPRALALSDRQCGQLIGALWSTDGCIDTFRGKKPRIIYTSVSENLCRDIQELLQRLGIVSSVRGTSVEYKGERRSVYTTQVISRASKRRFVALARAGIIHLTRSAVDLDTFENAIPTSNQASDASHQPMLSDTLWWDRVIALEHGAAEPLYDVEVPGVHTFVAEGIVTHNTSSEDIEPGSDYWQRLRLDAQVYAYIVGARALGHDVAGCLYDVIGKPRIQPLQATPEESRKYTKSGALYANQRDRAETVDEYRERLRAQIIESPDRYYVRGTVVRLAEDEREAALDLWQIAREIREADLGLRHPRNPDACKSWGRTCEYFAVCARETDLDDPTRYRRAAAAHEELSAPPAVAA